MLQDGGGGSDEGGLGDRFPGLEDEDYGFACGDDGFDEGALGAYEVEGVDLLMSVFLHIRKYTPFSLKNIVSPSTSQPVKKKQRNQTTHINMLPRRRIRPRPQLPLIPRPRAYHHHRGIRLLRCPHRGGDPGLVVRPGGTPAGVRDAACGRGLETLQRVGVGGGELCAVDDVVAELLGGRCQ